MKKVMIITIFLISTMSFAVYAVDADEAKTLAKSNNCFRCHGVDKAKDGPAFNAVAVKYKGDPAADAKLMHHLSSGEPAKFPDGHTEPHMILKSDASDFKNLVDWILSL